MNRWTPMPCRPIAFSMPDGVSTMRGGGCPSRSARNSPLTATPPSDDEIDDVGVLDAVAEAAARRDQRIGERERSDVRRERSISVSRPHGAQRSRPRRRAGRRTRDPRCTCACGAARPPSAPTGEHRRSCSSRRGRSPSPARARRRRRGRARPRAARRRASSASGRRRTASRDCRAGARSSAASSGAVMRPRTPRLPSSVASTIGDAERLEELDAVELVRRGGRRRTASSPSFRAASAAASVTNGASPTPPAIIHASAGGSTGSNGRPSGPSSGSRAPASTRDSSVVPAPTRLLKIDTPDGRAVRVAQDFENRERTPQQREFQASARRLDHHELSGLRGGRDLRRGEREDVVVRRQPTVRDHRGVDVYGHTRSIHLAPCASCGCSPTRCSPARWEPHTSPSSCCS